MKNSIILYTHPMSRGRTVRWVLEEIGCKYEEKILEFGSTMKEPAYLKVNPMGKVPALQHGQTNVTETVAICTYLAEAFPEAKLLPTALEDKAAFHRWMHFLSGPFEYAIMNKYCGFEPNQQQKGMLGYGDFDLAVNTFAKALQGQKHLAGSQFTVLDLYATAALAFYMSMDMIPKLDAFTDFVNHHKDRPAAIKAAAMDNALIEKKSS